MEVKLVARVSLKFRARIAPKNQSLSFTKGPPRVAS